VKKEFPTYPKTMVYACQENAWMDERVMLLWVQKVLKPYIDRAPLGVVPIIFLDSYRCHMMESVVQEIQGLGVEVEHIPGGCTFLCQPVDVGYNKPLKVRIRKEWVEWMIREGLINGTTSPPSRELICQWVDTATTEISKETTFNAWRHDLYTWFIQGAVTNPFDEPFDADESIIEETHSDNEIGNDSSDSSDSDSTDNSDSGNGLVYNIASRHRDVIINNESEDDETGDDASMDTYVTV
jgi:DDE superfamily endonuclease